MDKVHHGREREGYEPSATVFERILTLISRRNQTFEGGG